MYLKASRIAAANDSMVHYKILNWKKGGSAVLSADLAGYYYK